MEVLHPPTMTPACGPGGGPHTSKGHYRPYQVRLPQAQHCSDTQQVAVHLEPSSPPEALCLPIFTFHYTLHNCTTHYSNHPPAPLTTVPPTTADLTPPPATTVPTCISTTRTTRHNMTVIYSYCVLILFSVCQDVAATVPSRTPGENMLNLPCPNAQDILPCLCYVDNKTYMNMDCSAVTSEDELAQVFSAYFPFQKINSLIIKDNRYLRVLRAGDLGNVSFSEFHISDGVLEEVEETALSGSISTAKTMYFGFNKITGFLFEHLYAYTKLQHLDVSFNSIQEFPFIYSQTLTYLDLSGNPLGHLPYIALKNLPSLVFVYLDRLAIQEIEPGTFAGLEELQLVSLNNNKLKSLPQGAMEVSNSLAVLSINSNSISNVAANGFPGLRSSIIFHNDNALRELEEQVWRPVLEENNYLHLKGNPLVCGCDVAWIILNTTFLDLISPDTTCTDEETLVNLDPSIYNDFC